MGQYFTSENIHRELLSIINPAVHLLSKCFVGCSGPVVECLNKINILQSTTQALCQNIRYTELCVQYEKIE